MTAHILAGAAGAYGPPPGCVVAVGPCWEAVAWQAAMTAACEGVTAAWWGEVAWQEAMAPCGAPSAQARAVAAACEEAVGCERAAAAR